MGLIKYAIDFFVHLQPHLIAIFKDFGIWAYLIMFLIIFCETGLVVTPFLPGDSVIFLLGALSASSAINVWLLFVILVIAAITGNMANYYIGKAFGHTVFNRDNVRFFNRKNLEKAHGFFEKYGSKTIIITRFVPIIRTFAPFAAGMGCMPYMKFIVYNIIGGISWVTLFLASGYFLGRFIPENKFSIIVLVIVVISLIPIIIEYLREKSKSKDKKKISN